MLTLFTILSFLISSPALAYPSTADVIMVHDMDMIKQQRFRMEEINDYNDVKTEKARYQKRNNPQPETPTVNRVFNSTPKKFVEEDGKIKIESQN